MPFLQQTVYKLTEVYTYVEAEPRAEHTVRVCTVLTVRVAQESSTHLCFAYVVLSASCYSANRQHVLYQSVNSAPSCYALVAKFLRMRGECK